MVNETRTPHPFPEALNFEQPRLEPRPKDLEALPAGAVLASFLKTLEMQFIKRGLVTPPRGEFHPIWFLVETERNIFLWRNGLSLCQADEFEFWVDPARLVEKRLCQLEIEDADNPFINSLWSIAHGTATLSVQEEKKYLSVVLEVLASVAPHAHALSEVSSILGGPAGSTRKPRVLLPCASLKRKKQALLDPK